MTKPLWTLAQVQHIARVELHKLGVQDIGWRLDGWHRERHIIGKAWHTPRKITLNKQSMPYQPEHVIIDVVRHEAAHAYAGHKAGHGQTWVTIAKHLGVKEPGPIIHGNVAAPSPYLQVCPGCLREWPRYRKTTTAYGCRSCKIPLVFIRNPHYIKF